MDCIIVTGAGSGIGKAAALDMAKKGFHVLCISKSNRASDTAAQINKEGGSAESLIINLADYSRVERELGGWLDLKRHNCYGIVLAAGVLGPRGPLEASSINEWDNCFSINVLGNLAVLQQVLPNMIENQFGRIVFFGGGGAAYAYPMFPAYAASKISIVRICENLHEDLKTKGNFAVVCLAPGANDTEMLKKIREAGAEVKTIVNIMEPVNFISSFILSQNCNFSGSFVHVRDEWAIYLNSQNNLIENKWKLRRIE